MGLGLERVPEEDDEIDGAFRDLGADLLVPAKRAALELDDGRLEGFLEKNAGSAGSAGGEQLMLSEKAAVEARPLEKVLFLVVVGDERDSLAGLVVRWRGQSWRVPHCRLQSSAA